MQELDLSNNPGLVKLPMEMSVLMSLEVLRCEGCIGLRSFIGVEKIELGVFELEGTQADDTALAEYVADLSPKFLAIFPALTHSKYKVN